MHSGQQARLGYRGSCPYNLQAMSHSISWSKWAASCLMLVFGRGGFGFCRQDQLQQLLKVDNAARGDPAAQRRHWPGAGCQVMSHLRRAGGEQAVFHSMGCHM